MWIEGAAPNLGKGLAGKPFDMLFVDFSKLDFEVGSMDVNPTGFLCQ